MTIEEMTAKIERDAAARQDALRMANKAHHDLCMGYAPCERDAECRQRILIDLDLIMSDLRRERA